MKQILVSLRVILIFTVITGGLYPLIMTGIAQGFFPHKANGSMIIVKGVTVGSELIGQYFTSEKYFHGRISSSEYDSLSSGGSNFGPANEKFIKRVQNDLRNIRVENYLPSNMKIPSELVTSSASGLDPHISLESALIQTKRVASARKIDESIIINIISKHIERRYFSIAGDKFVNVLSLNIALDEQGE